MSTNEVKPSPGIVQGNQIFEIFYKTGNMANHQRFYAPNKETAIELGREWAATFGFTFINVYPFTVNLKEAIESHKNRNGSD